MAKFWNVLKFVGQVIALAVAAFAGSAVSGCACVPLFSF